MGKRALAVGSAFFVEKLGDVKLVAALKEMLISCAEVCGPKFVSGQIIKHASKAKAPKVHQEACALLVDIIDQFGATGAPLKETIDYGQLAAGQTTPAVR